MSLLGFHSPRIVPRERFGGYSGMLLLKRIRRPLILELKCIRPLCGHQLQKEKKKNRKTPSTNAHRQMEPFSFCEPRKKRDGPLCRVAVKGKQLLRYSPATTFPWRSSCHYLLYLPRHRGSIMCVRGVSSGVARASLSKLPG